LLSFCRKLVKSILLPANYDFNEYRFHFLLGIENNIIVCNIHLWLNDRWFSPCRCYFIIMVHINQIILRDKDDVCYYDR
jgi:hypothetical protein